eukprot:GFYU01000046.1.p1 GENE.GFYU01000046.1~~GFYU01000046.1.p1  ORF type:complete len:369 (+),score=130.43 GFYU01000046.1:368-1474(+)
MEDPREKISHLVRPMSEFGEDYSWSSKALGAGSFAEVRIATTVTGPRQKVAVKMIAKEHPELCENAYHNLYGEVDMLTKLEDVSGVPMVLDVFEDDRCLYIVMPCLGGGDLADHLINEEMFSEKHAGPVFYQLVATLCDLHERNIAHCDLKPDNIVFTRPTVFDASLTPDTVSLNLVDFGTAHDLDEIDGTKICGTSTYLAPEMIHVAKGNQDSWGVEVDMWSAGVVLYVMLTGYQPFTEEFGGKELIRCITTASYEIPAFRKRGMSEEALDLIASLLEVDPERRLSAEEALAHPWLSKFAPRARKSNSSSRSSSRDSSPTSVSRRGLFNAHLGPAPSATNGISLSSSPGGRSKFMSFVAKAFPIASR